MGVGIFVLNFPSWSHSLAVWVDDGRSPGAASPEVPHSTTGRVDASARAEMRFSSPFCLARLH